MTSLSLSYGCKSVGASALAIAPRSLVFDGVFKPEAFLLEI